MKLSIKILVASLLFLLMSFSVQAVADKKPLIHESETVTIEATVEKIDRKTRQLTLKGNEGKSVTVTLDDKAGKLDKIDVGDLVVINYLESVTIQVFDHDQAEPGAVAVEAVAKTKPGEKPAGVVAGQVSVIVTIEAIDLKNELVTLKRKDGVLSTVKAQNPANLKKVKVGDRVQITHTQAVGFSVTEK